MLRSEFVYLHEMTMSFPTWEMMRECLTIESEESPTNVFGTYVVDEFITKVMKETAGKNNNMNLAKSYTNVIHE